MSKEDWFRHYERIEAERPELSEDTLADLACEALADEMADQVDLLYDEAKETNRGTSLPFLPALG